MYIDIDGNAFPSVHWTDSVSEALIMWTESFLSLLETGLNGEEEFFFLSGPFSFTIRADGTRMAQLHLLKNAKPINESPYEISFYCIIHRVYRLIEDVTSDERLKDVQQLKRLKNMSARFKSAAEHYGYHME
jgi:hypothetical protein